MSDRSSDPESARNFARRAPMIASAAVLFGPLIGLVAFELFASVEARSELAFMLGFEPWRVSRVAVVPASNAEPALLVEEQFSPQRGTWTRFTLVSLRGEVQARLALSDRARLRAVAPDAAWIEVGSELRHVSLPTLGRSEPLENYVRAQVGDGFVSSSLAEDGSIRVTMSDGTVRTVGGASEGAYLLPQNVGLGAGLRRLQQRSGQAAGTSLRIERSEHRGRVMRVVDERYETVAELLEPSFLLDGRDRSPIAWSDRPLLYHRRSLADPEVGLVSRAGRSGLEWTLDLAQVAESSDASATLEWLTRSGEEIVLLVDVRAGRRSRTELVRIDARGQVVKRTPFR